MPGLCYLYRYIIIKIIELNEQYIAPVECCDFCMIHHETTLKQWRTLPIIRHDEHIFSYLEDFLYIDDKAMYYLVTFHCIPL